MSEPERLSLDQPRHAPGSPFETWPVRPERVAPVAESPESITSEQLASVEGLAHDALRLQRLDYAHLGGPGPVQLAGLELWRGGYQWYSRAERLGIARQFWRASVDATSAGVQDTPALQAVRAFCPDVDGACLGLLGPTGTGKTFAAVAAIREHMTSRITEAFYHVPALARSLMSFDTRDATMERACGLALVVVDDLGAQYTRDGGGQAEALLEELIWYREAHRKTTVFTSNLPLKLLAEHLGDRVTDRLRGWGMLHELPGKSLRAPRRRT